MSANRVANHPIHQHILRYKNARWAYIGIGLVIICSIIYWTQNANTPPSGSTWQGYFLGTVGVLLVLWLTLLGVRKRSYRAAGTVEAWTSAHVYLGTACLIIATLHCAFQFGNNVHTLAYLLMCLVIFSGFYGLYAYLRFPTVAAKNRADKSRAELLEQLAELDQQSLALAQKVGPEVYSYVDSAVERTSIGGNRWQQLMGSDASQILSRSNEGGGTGSKLIANKDQSVAIDYLAKRMSKSPNGEEAIRLQNLVRTFAARRGVLRRLRKDIQLQGLLQVWLFIHVPLTLALLFALTLHIVSVFFYW